MAVTSSPTASDLLAEIAKNPPWFPANGGPALGAPRQLLDSLLDELRQAGLVEARDWVKGLGQGYALTADGERVLANPTLLMHYLAGGSSDTLPYPRPGATTFDRGERARAAFYEPKTPVITQILIAINIAVFIVGLGFAGKEGRSRSEYLRGRDLATLVQLGAASGPRLAAGDWWRLETANFVHIGVMHLALNVYCLALVGGLAENLWGRRRFLPIYLVAGLAGTALAMTIQPRSLVAGASGATWGVMVSLAVWLVQYRQHFPPEFTREFARRLAFAIIVNAAFSLVPGVSWEGHLGGAIAGAMMAVALDAIRPGYPRRTIAGYIAAIAVPLLFLGILAYTASRTPSWRMLRAVQARIVLQSKLAPIQDDLNALRPANLEAFANEVARKPPPNEVRLFQLEKRAGVLMRQADTLTEKSAESFAGDEALKSKVNRYVAAVKELARQSLDYEIRKEPAYREAIEEIVAAWDDLYRSNWSD